MSCAQLSRLELWSCVINDVKEHVHTYVRCNDDENRWALPVEKINVFTLSVNNVPRSSCMGQSVFGGNPLSLKHVRNYDVSWMMHGCCSTFNFRSMCFLSSIAESAHCVRAASTSSAWRQCRVKARERARAGWKRARRLRHFRPTNLLLTSDSPEVRVWRSFSRSPNPSSSAGALPRKAVTWLVTRLDIATAFRIWTGDMWAEVTATSPLATSVRHSPNQSQHVF